MLDLIYDDKEAKLVVSKQFPLAILEDESDEVHLERFSVEQEISKEEWYAFLMESGLCNASLNFGLDMGIEKGREVIKKVLDAHKQKEVAS